MFGMFDIAEPQAVGLISETSASWPNISILLVPFSLSRTEKEKELIKEKNSSVKGTWPHQ